MRNSCANEVNSRSSTVTVPSFTVKNGLGRSLGRVHTAKVKILKKGIWAPKNIKTGVCALEHVGYVVLL